MNFLFAFLAMLFAIAPAAAQDKELMEKERTEIEGWRKKWGEQEEMARAEGRIPQVGKTYVVLSSGERFTTSARALRQNLGGASWFKILELADAEVRPFRNFKILLSTGNKVEIRDWIIEEAIYNRLVVEQESMEERADKDPDPAGSFLSKKKKFRPDGMRIIEAGSSREEGTYDGVEYQFYHRDGSASFGKHIESLTLLSGWRKIKGWSLQCKQDPMDDQRYCFATQGDLSVGLFDDGDVFIQVGSGSSRPPGSSPTIRFGKEPPIQISAAGWQGSAAKQLLNKLISAKSVKTRYVKIGREMVDGDVDLFGLKEVYDYIRWAITQPYNGSFRTKRASTPKDKAASPQKPKAREKGI